MTEIASVRVASRERPDADLVVAGCFEGEAPEAAGLDERIRQALERLAGRSGWKGKDEQTAQTEAGPDGPVVTLSGLGARKEFSHLKLARWLCRTAEEARVSGARRLAVALPGQQPETGGGAAERVLRELALSVYRYDRFHTEADKANRLEEVAAVPPAGEEEAYRGALESARKVAEAVAFARDLSNAPANVASPAWLEERALELAESKGLRATVLDVEELERRGMGGILAVGSGSAHPPRLVRLEWGDSGPAVSLVGKGITFDTGGISIKPATDMDEMKFDKSGACSILGLARAVVDLNLPVRLRVYAAIAENMLGSKAYRPSDILRCYNGKTVEITNTAAAFLSQFVGETRRWAHLDIAGVAYVGADQSPCTGATGFGVALTLNWLRRLLG
jgi:leucyl aminopeptidase